MGTLNLELSECPMKFKALALTSVLVATTALNIPPVQAEKPDVKRSCIEVLRGVTFPIPGMLRSQDKRSQINVRDQPNASAYIRHIGYANDLVIASQRVRDNDGYCWYRVKFQSKAEGWVRGDFMNMVMDDIPPRL